MGEIYLIRHGSTPGNEKRKYIGSTDEALSEKGILQAKELGLNDSFEGRVIVSPMNRCVMTAKIAFPEKEMEIHDDLREMDFGVFEGRSASEMEDDKDYREWVYSNCTKRPPKGESVTGFKERSIKAFREISEKYPNEDIAIVTHGGVIMAILEAYAQPKKSFYEWHLGCCEYYHLCRNDNKTALFVKGKSNKQE